MNHANLSVNTEVQLPTLGNWGDDTWRKKAKCQGVDTNIFFPTKESLDGLTDRQKAVRHRTRDLTDPNLQSNLLSQARVLCAKCPVRKQCLAFAVENGITHGMYGGIPPRDRRGMTSTNLGKGIKSVTVMKDLHRVRRLSTSTTKTPLAHDVAEVFNVTVARAEKMLKSNDFPEYI